MLALTSPAVSRKPAMTDVARLAGVSHQTVSRVLNGSDLVRPDTKARVLDAVERLGYRRNVAARALASRRSGIIGVLSMETTLHGPASTLLGIERAARVAGYFVSVAAIDDGRPDSTVAAVERLVAQGVEGVAIIAPLAQSSDPLRSLPEG